MSVHHSNGCAVCACTRVLCVSFNLSICICAVGFGSTVINAEVTRLNATKEKLLNKCAAESDYRLRAKSELHAKVQGLLCCSLHQYNIRCAVGQCVWEGLLIVKWFGGLVRRRRRSCCERRTSSCWAHCRSASIVGWIMLGLNSWTDHGRRHRAAGHTADRRMDARPAGQTAGRTAG